MNEDGQPCEDKLEDLEDEAGALLANADFDAEETNPKEKKA